MIGFFVADEIVFTRLLRINTQSFAPHGRWMDSRAVYFDPAEARIGRWYVTYASGHQGHLARWRWFYDSRMGSQAEDSRVLLLLHRVLLTAFVACGVVPFVIATWLQYRANNRAGDS